MSLSKNHLQFFTNWVFGIYLILILMDITGKKIKRELWESIQALKHKKSLSYIHLINFRSHLLPLVFIYFYKPKNLVGVSNKRNSFIFALLIYFLYTLFFNSINIYALTPQSIFYSFSFTILIFIYIINRIET